MQQYYEVRSRAIQKLRAIPNEDRTLTTPSPYPHKFHVTIALPSFVKKYDALIKEGGIKNADVVSIAGRIHNLRAAGAKLIFYDIISEGARVQIMAQSKYTVFLICYRGDGMLTMELIQQRVRVTRRI